MVNFTPPDPDASSEVGALLSISIVLMSLVVPLLPEVAWIVSIFAGLCSIYLNRRKLWAEFKGHFKKRKK